MANYSTMTVIRPALPMTDITPLTKLVLQTILEWEKHDDKIYFFSRDNYGSTTAFEADALERATKETQKLGGPERVYTLPISQLREREGKCDMVDIEFDDNFVHQVLQDVIHRSSSVDRIEVVSSYLCDSMRQDGFGGGATVITSDEIRSFSTNAFLATTC